VVTGYIDLVLHRDLFIPVHEVDHFLFVTDNIVVVGAVTTVYHYIYVFEPFWL
jgi:hypothetical protein